MGSPLTAGECSSRWVKQETSPPHKRGNRAVGSGKVGDGEENRSLQQLRKAPATPWSRSSSRQEEVAPLVVTVLFFVFGEAGLGPP